MNDAISKYVGTNSTEPFDATLIEDFHESSKYMPATSAKRDARISNYLTDEECLRETCSNFKSYDNYPQVALPSPKPLSSTYESLLDGRESQREYSGSPLSLVDVSTVLSSVQINRTMEPLGSESRFTLGLRRYPSPGALYPTEVYVLALRVDDLEPAIYHFDIRNSALSQVAVLPSEAEVAHAFGDATGETFGQLGMVVVLTSVLPRVTVKYENQGYRFALLEAGMVGLQLNLASEAAGLASTFWGAAYDDLVHDMLGVDGVEEVLLNVLFVGHEAG